MLDGYKNKMVTDKKTKGVKKAKGKKRERKNGA